MTMAMIMMRMIIFSSICSSMADDNDFVYFTDSAIHLVVHCVDVNDDKNCVTGYKLVAAFSGFPKMNQWHKI